MLLSVLKGLLGRVAGLALFVGGFWLLIVGFQDTNIPLGILGGAMIPLGMWVMVVVRYRQQGI